AVRRRVDATLGAERAVDVQVVGTPLAARRDGHPALLQRALEAAQQLLALGDEHVGARLSAAGQRVRQLRQRVDDARSVRWCAPRPTPASGEALVDAAEEARD